jgi:hypothetical protein
MKTLVIAAALIAPHNFTPVSPVEKARCLPQQVCQTCYRSSQFEGTVAYRCNCYLTCTPGT